MLIFLTLNLILLVLINRVVEKALLKKEIEKDIAIIRGVANNVLAIEQLTERLLFSALRSFEDHLLVKPNASNNELKILKDKLNVTSLITFNKEVRYIKYAKGGVEFDRETHAKLKHVSLFKKPYSASYRDLQGKSGTVLQLPFFLSATRELFTNNQVITKAAAVWLDSLQMYLCVTFDEGYVHEHFDNNLKSHKELLYISIITPSGIPLIQTMRDNYQIKYKTEEVGHYSETPIVQNNDSIELILPFGGIQHENESAINKGLANSNNEYFYILKAGFSKKEITTQLISVRIIFTIILFLMSSIFYLVNNQFKQRALHLFSLKHQAQQIHHDIANPVQSVDWGINQMILEKKHNENKLIKLRDSVGMIKGIIHDLYYLHDNKFQRKELVKSAELLYPILDSVVSSARLFISNDMQVILQKSHNWNILVNIDNIVLRRALLNLVKNSVEALGKNGVVRIAFSKRQHNAIIKISDNGIGMDEKTVQKLLEGKSTIHSKDTGRGLGFSYAKQAIESFGGNIAIQSKLNKGTKQVITLPIEAKKPIWFVDKIDLEKYKILVVFDDNKNIHEIYKQKFNDKKLIHFSTVNEFERHMINTNNRNNAFFFIDYALNVIIPNGIDLIKRYQLELDSILVTNMYLEKGVKDKCLQCGIKILPKGMIEFI